MKRRGPSKAKLLIMALIVSFSSIGMVLYSSAAEGNAQALHIGQPLTPIEGLKVGDSVRLEGKLLGSDTFKPHLEDPACVAHQTTARRMVEGKDQRAPDFIQREGPKVLEIDLDGTIAHVDLAYWSPQVWAKKAHLDAPPKWTGLDAEPGVEIELAEHTLRAGDAVFVAGKVASLKPLVLEAAPELGRVEVFRGPQRALKSALLGRDMAFRVAAFALWGLSVFLIGMLWMIIRFGRAERPAAA